ncbi:hydrolase [Streptomyces albiaxialis]|uniref:Hydrolase n=1 Tax=Streptomyces albiaxialis TaxID=329523 RepID=A0ABN2W682_9ACTN
MSIRPLTATATAGGALLGMTALFLTAAPGAAAAPQSDSPLPVAHRGASAYAPENTLAAVDKADELGIQWVENDVQRTKDGKLVILHDTTLARTTDVEQKFPDRAPWNVADFTAKEIRKLDAGSWFNKRFKGERIPTLHEYMQRVSRNGQRLLMELKAPELYPGIEKQTLAELRKDGWLDKHHLKKKLIVQSFNATSVEKVHELKPAVKTGFLGNPAASELKKYAKFSDQINPRHAAVTKDYVQAIHGVKGPHGRPLEVFTWTVDDAATAVRVARAGVDGIISNKPDLVRDATRGLGSGLDLDY